jgi:demethylmenaquinone methyltransferase/2-methoxy-6-polyprenyl-1,4-benzoquinol methylase
MFAAIADRYDLINSLLSFRRDRSWRRFAASRSSIRPGGLVLDIATGTGELARHLSQSNCGATIVGVDFCPDMLLKARGKLASFEGNVVQLVLGDALKLPFPDSTFDSVTIGFALRNVADLDTAFSEIARVVKPGGRVVSLELSRPSFMPIRKLYNFLLFRIAPRLGGMMSGSRAAYTYLPDSIMEFPTPEQVKETMEKAGLCKVDIHRLTLGIAAVHVAVKSETSSC